jgi:pilus assembly protein FimV
LVALFNSNQNAFDGANMNRLRSGSIITILNAVEASAGSVRATRVVRVQSADWRGYRDGRGVAPMADEGAPRRR